MRYILFCFTAFIVSFGSLCQIPAPVGITGQHLSHASGDDGDLQAGIPWPVPRFTDNGDGTVTDNLTGLMWLQQANAIGNIYPSFDNDETPGDGMVFWQTALDFVFGMNDGLYPSGVTTFYQDWRLPNIRELESLIDYGNLNPAVCDTLGTGKCSPGDPFFGIENAYYWTSTTNANYTNGAWFVALGSGYMNAVNKTSVTYHVWAVRTADPYLPLFPEWPSAKDIRDFIATLDGSSAFPAPVEATGQTDSYASFDDGELQEGVPLPTPRFTENGDNTITDNLTGLMWMRNANPIGDLHPEFDDDDVAEDGLVYWQTALDFAAAVNAGTYGCGVTTVYADWRLPNIRELSSLVHYKYVHPCISSMDGTTIATEADPFFGLQTGGNYWSSTSEATPTPVNSWVSVSTFGPLIRFQKTETFRVWLVRGP